MTQAEPATNALMAGALLMTSDQAWRDFGYRAHPGSAPWYARFRGLPFRELEFRISRILFCGPVAAHIAAGRLDQTSAIDMVSRTTSDVECRQSFGFDCRIDAMMTLGDIVLSLASNDPTRWGRILVSRLDLLAVHDFDKRAMLVHGTVVLAASLRQMTHRLSVERHPQRANVPLSEALRQVSSRRARSK
jgi:hypothetical protein